MKNYTSIQPNDAYEATREGWSGNPQRISEASEEISEIGRRARPFSHPLRWEKGHAQNY